jgi:hypothetical protein
VNPPAYKKGQPVWFKRKPRGAGVFPDSEFVRDMGMVQEEPVCEIIYRRNTWIVRYSEIKAGLSDYAKQLKEEIDSKTLLGQFKKDLAAALGISPATLNKRLKFIAEHLEKENPATVSDGGNVDSSAVQIKESAGPGE